MKFSTAFVFPTLLVFLSLLSGCGTFSRHECEQMDWARKGRETAMRGQTLNQAEHYYETECHERNDVAVDQKSFGEGYNEGLKQFCSPEYVRQFAQNGGVYQNTCSQMGDDKIIEKFRGGRIQYLEKQVADLNSQVGSLNSQVSSLQSETHRCEHRRPFVHHLRCAPFARDLTRLLRVSLHSCGRADLIRRTRRQIDSGRSARGLPPSDTSRP